MLLIYRRILYFYLIWDQIIIGDDRWGLWLKSQFFVVNDWIYYRRWFVGYTTNTKDFSAIAWRFGLIDIH